MKIIKEQSEFGLNIFLKEGGKSLAFTFQGNGDLYWTIHRKSMTRDNDYMQDSFIISKKNYNLYRLFEELFLDIENINIFDIEEDIPFYIDTAEEKMKYLEKIKKEIEEDKVGYRLYNHSNYNELFDINNKIITWYSDEAAREVANVLKIKKEDNAFKIDFYTQPHIEGYDKDFQSPYYIPIRFRNSGSSYSPFNIIFMRMYNSMQRMEDTNDYVHQIDMEEYLYEHEKIKRLIK